MPFNLTPVDVRVTASPHLAIAAKHKKLGGWLGAAVGDVIACPDGRGWFQNFQNGSIYWALGVGAHEIHGGIRDRWAAMGRELRFGYPTSDELGVGDGRGRVSHFERGSIYWTPQTGAHEIYGGIRDKWLSLGGPASFLGYPTTGEEDLPYGRGRFNNFERGQIAWSPTSGAVVSATTYEPPAQVGGLLPQGLGPMGIPEVRRKVVCSGTMSITDDEVFDDEHGEASSPPLEAVVTNESPQEVLSGFVGTAGGEVRVEVKLIIQARSSGDVGVTGRVTLFEGTSTDTNDEDGHVDIAITVARDQFRSHSVRVTNTDEGGDHAELTFNFSNFPV